jgi:hypothetical protein
MIITDMNANEEVQTWIIIELYESSSGIGGQILSSLTAPQVIMMLAP